MKQLRLKSRWTGVIVEFCFAVTLTAQVKTDTVTILSFNDFHGAFVPDQGVPGATALVGTIDRLKGGDLRCIVVSGGDNFSGSHFSRVTRGKPLQDSSVGRR